MSNENKIKNGGEGTRVGNFLRSIDKGELLQNIVSGDFLGALATVVSKKGDLTSEQTKEFNRLYVLDAQDRADARAMQVAIATSKESTTLAKNFVYYLSIGVFIFSATTVLLLFFVEIPDKNRDVINFILGVLVGTGLTGVFNYFLGSSKGSSDKMNHIINTKK